MNNIASEINSISNTLTSRLKFASFFYNFFNLKLVNTEKERKIFTNIWYNIWLKEGYATSGEPILEKKKAYEKVSQDFLIKFLFISIGTIRIIRPNQEMGFPVINNFEIQKDFVNEKTVELSLFAIRKCFRFSHISTLISIKKIYKLLKMEGITGFLAALDHRLFHFLKEKLQIPLQKIGKEKVYEGSLTYPVYLNLKEGEEFLKEKAYQVYQYFCK
jgi:hypothetical protein